MEDRQQRLLHELNGLPKNDSSMMIETATRVKRISHFYDGPTSMPDQLCKMRLEIDKMGREMEKQSSKLNELIRAANDIMTEMRKQAATQSHMFEMQTRNLVSISMLRGQREKGEITVIDQELDEDKDGLSSIAAAMAREKKKKKVAPAKVAKKKADQKKAAKPAIQEEDAELQKLQKEVSEMCEPPAEKKPRSSSEQAPVLEQVGSAPPPPTAAEADDEPDEASQAVSNIPGQSNWAEEDVSA